MKIIVAIIVFNRFENIKRWLNCWAQCNQENAELIILHNDNGESQKFKSICDEVKVKYIRRPNVGFDVGCFQDICRERLKEFPNDWDFILWATDDTFPMSKDFITPFIEKHKPGVGITCMQISKSTAAEIHVRTTGFCITKEISRRLTFPADPITTKQQCYLFEHRGGKKTLTNQIRSMGLSCEMVAHTTVSPLWDMGYWKRLDRLAEHNRVFGIESNTPGKVLFIATIYNSYPQIISSLFLQTHKNWELLLIHDGPMDKNLYLIIDNMLEGGDSRIKLIETKSRIGNWGHGLRQWALNEIKDRTDIGYVCVTNADNYYCPVFTEYVLKGFEKSHTAVASHCSEMVHSYKAWQVLPVRNERGFMDSGVVIVKKDVAVEVGWNDIETHSADWTYFQDIANRYSWKNFVSVKGCLFCHN